MNHQKMESELIKQRNSDLEPQPSLGIFGILRESFKTTNRNGKLLFPILLLVFLFFSLLDFVQIYLLEPVADDFSLQLAKHPNMSQDFGNNMNKATYSDAINDIRELLLVKLLALTFSSIISLLFFVATVSSSFEAYTAKLLDPKEMIAKIRKSWKRPFATSFYLILITLGPMTACFFSIGMVSVLAGDSWATYLFYGVLFFSILVSFFYISVLWMMSLVVSVLEDVGGLNAIVRAIELMKGKRVQASLIMVLVAVAYGLVHLTTDALTSYNLDKWSRVAVTIPISNGLMCMLKLFVFVVFTIFYHEQKENREKKETKGFYVPIVAAGEV